MSWRGRKSDESVLLIWSCIVRVVHFALNGGKLVRGYGFLGLDGVEAGKVQQLPRADNSLL